MKPAGENGWVDRPAQYLNGAAGAVLTAMMLVTVADIALRSVFALPIFGTFDLVELALVTMIFLALPETFREQDHIVVDVVDHVAGERVAGILRVIGGLLAVVLLSLMLRYSLAPAYDTYRFGEKTLDLEIPRFIHWIPILFGTAIAIVYALTALRRNAGALRRHRRAS